jgi:hypothetical protein
MKIGHCGQLMVFKDISVGIAYRDLVSIAKL